MSIIARPAIGAEILNVFSRLTLDRKTEMTATAWGDSIAQMANELILVIKAARDAGREVPMYALFGLDSTVPLAIVGVVPYGPGLGGMVWAGAPEWGDYAIPSHRWWRKFFVPDVLGKYRRVEFTAWKSDMAARRWLSGLGFTEEGIAYRQGKRGEDFVHYAWVNPDRTIGVSS